MTVEQISKETRHFLEAIVEQDLFMFNAELWHLEKGEPKLQNRVALMYKIEDLKKWKETYFVGAYYEKGESIFSAFIDKIKNTDAASMGSLATQILGQSNS